MSVIIEIHNPIFGSNLRFLRKKYRLSQTGLACLVGISVHSLRDMENHRYPTRMTAYTLQRFCDVLNVPMEHLTGSELENLEEIPRTRRK